MKNEAINDSVMTPGKHSALVVKARRWIAFLKAVSMADSMAAPVFPVFPSDLEITDFLVASGDTNWLEGLMDELHSLVRSHIMKVEGYKTRAEARQLLADLQAACQADYANADAGVASKMSA